MRGTTARAQLEPENAARRQAEAVVGRLAVDQEAAAGRDVVRDARAVAAAFFADDEDESDA